MVDKLVGGRDTGRGDHKLAPAVTGPIRGMAAVALACFALMIGAGLGPWVAPAAANQVIGAVGEGNGQYMRPESVAVDEATGEVFVADQNNRRIDVFDVSGAFLRAFGWGVVASGPDNNPKNEIQKVTVNATGGLFALKFYDNSERTFPTSGETKAIAYNASAAAVQEALVGLAALEPDDVVVTGPAGGPWSIEFTGGYADMAISPLVGNASGLTGISKSVNVVVQQVGANYEVCRQSAGDICRLGQRGAEAGQISPRFVAVDPGSHAVYVYDGLETDNEPSNDRVQKFTEAGEFLYMLGGGVNLTNGTDFCAAGSGDVCGRGEKGSGAGELSTQQGSLAIGPGGVLHVNDGGRVQRFTSAGAPIDSLSLPAISASDLAVDAASNIFGAKTFNAVAPVFKYSASGSLLYERASSNTNALAVDGSGNALTADNVSGGYGITRLSPSGEVQSVSYTDGGKFIGGASEEALAAYGSSEAFAVERSVFPNAQPGVVRVSLAPPGPAFQLADGSTFASAIGNKQATLNASVNPEGKASEVQFEYVDQEGFEEAGFGGAGTKVTAKVPTVGSAFHLETVSAGITGLTPETVYHFRAIGFSADAPSGRTGPPATFETAPPVSIDALWSTGVGSDTATLAAEVNPLAIAATGYFEYVDQASFEASGFDDAVKLPDVDGGADPLDFGAGEAPVVRDVQPYPLQPGTTYRYRLVAHDHCKTEEPAVVCEFKSSVHSLTTIAQQPPPPTSCSNASYRSGPGAYLPDCRAYEMVSPIDKSGGNIEVVYTFTGFPAGFDQSALDGNSLAYSSYKAFADPQSAPYTSNYIASRGPAGWTSQSVSAPRKGPSLFIYTGLDTPFKAFTPDLCRGWFVQDTDLALTPGAISGFPNLYRRQNCGASGGAYSLLTATSIKPTIEPHDFRPELQGVSRNGAVAVFRVPEKLTSEAKKGIDQVYEAREGQALKLVCILPNGTASKTGCSLGTSVSGGNEREDSISRAVSEDGSKVFWSAYEGSLPGQGKLYVRLDGSETVAVEEGAAAQFWTAAADGSVAIFSVGANLYEFDVDTRVRTKIAGGLVGVAGASEDASRIYFASTEVLAPEAVAGQPNLYLDEGGSFDLVGTLASSESFEYSPLASSPYRRTSQVTPDGEQIVFSSKAPLTNYDNLDAATGQADLEVFRYDADGGEVACISCNPTGARPLGRVVKYQPGGFAYATAARIPTAPIQLHTPRAISDNGRRVFFQSFEALVSRDTNGAGDVYQWEAPGSGDCTPSSASYVVGSGGCLSLISSGESENDSELVDSSASGNDVFFRTYSKLDPRDPGLLDIYDARVGGGYPPPEASTPPCEGEACQSPSVAPDDQTPASATFVGPGNVVEKAKPRRCPKGKHKVKRKGKVSCVKNKKAKKRASHKRSRGGRR